MTPQFQREYFHGGVVHLTFLDSMHGNDVAIVIEPNGEAYYTAYVDDSDEPQLTHIPNLGLALIELCDKIAATYSEVKP